MNYRTHRTVKRADMCAIKIGAWFWFCRKFHF